MTDEQQWDFDDELTGTNAEAKEQAGLDPATDEFPVPDEEEKK